ncbi:hypothetical protein J2X65_002289 [Ancylobacter sp. 3268]|uniref:hypothetical protein n=1 Tax=Ancylobacter sp. 3268 TaxID=2817752 RepID=UPI002865E5DA|nr:hypothetical protein [Ancylobacter sp. 3268]MDR6952930.1 hypothetical protein [Ancylobacter sp. 3268]
MRTLRHVPAVAAICMAFAVPPATAQSGNAPDTTIHDGIWRVATEPVTGPCSKRMEFKLAVEDGQISYAGVWPVDASGTINPVGLVTIRVVRGEETVSAKGLVRGDTASGDWVSPAKNCSGSWIARKA